MRKNVSVGVGVSDGYGYGDGYGDDDERNARAVAKNQFTEIAIFHSGKQ